MRRRIALAVLILITSIGFARPASAVMQFQKEFLKLYVGNDTESEFARQARTAKCFCCHQGRKSKKNRNPYGQELAKLLDRKTDAKNPEKIIAAINKVADMHSDPNDPTSPTFGELIKAGKLPGGPLDKAKEEPTAE